MEGIQHDADIGAVGAAHDFPDIAIIPGMQTPCQRLEADAHAAGGRTLSKLGNVGGEPVNAGLGIRRKARTHEQKVRTKLLQEVELALRAVEGALALVGRHALEITKRLTGDDPKIEVIAHAPDIARRAGIGDQVILENLDRRKPAAAMASSSSWRLPEMQTVAIEVFTFAPQ